MRIFMLCTMLVLLCGCSSIDHEERIAALEDSVFDDDGRTGIPPCVSPKLSAPKIDYNIKNIPLDQGEGESLYYINGSYLGRY